jgi:hypothetical protein
LVTKCSLDAIYQHPYKPQNQGLGLLFCWMSILKPSIM